MQWGMPAIPVLGRLRHRDHKIQVSLGSISKTPSQTEMEENRHSKVLRFICQLLHRCHSSHLEGRSTGWQQHNDIMPHCAAKMAEEENSLVYLPLYGQLLILLCF
jgi:hypothetical protein